VSVSGPRVVAAGPALGERIERICGSAWCDVSPDEITLEWRWMEAVPAPKGLRR
jgi:hypothetical protein